MEYTLSRLTAENASELIDFLNLVGSEKTSPNILSMYANAEGFQKRLSQNIDIVLLAKVEDETVGVISAITNRISNPENDSWTIVSFIVLDNYKETQVSDRLLSRFTEEIKKTTAYKITTTFPADDYFQQMQLIKHLYRQEGYYVNGIKRGRDLVCYSLLLE